MVQGLTKVMYMYDSPGLVDFPVGQADFSGHLLHGQARLKFVIACSSVDWTPGLFKIDTGKSNWSVGFPKAKLQSWPKLCGTSLQNALPRPSISFSHGNKRSLGEILPSPPPPPPLPEMACLLTGCHCIVHCRWPPFLCHSFTPGNWPGRSTTGRGAAVFEWWPIPQQQCDFWQWHHGLLQLGMELHIIAVLHFVSEAFGLDMITFFRLEGGKWLEEEWASHFCLPFSRVLCHVLRRVSDLIFVLLILLQGPGQYFFRPMLKEYVFSPASQVSWVFLQLTGTGTCSSFWCRSWRSIFIIMIL